MEKTRENHYDTLEIPETANQDEIKKSYRRLSLKYHPDRNIGKPEMGEIFQKINAAFEVIGNPEKRQEYDVSRKNPFERMSMGGDGHPFQQQMDQMFSQMFFGGGIRHGPGVFGMGHGPNIQIFRNGVPVNITNALLKPTPIIQNIRINMEQVLSGSTLPVEIERWIVENGEKVFEKQTIYITIPKGIDDNEIILLKDQGNVANENCRGDIKIFVHVDNNTGLQRNGLDLLYEKKISLKDSLCGFAFELKYINGKSYTINNQRGNIIPPNFTKVIPNMGLTRDAHTGNLLIHFSVEFPESIDPEKIEKLSELL